MRKKYGFVLFVACLSFMLTGCANTRLLKTKVNKQSVTITNLTATIEELGSHVRELSKARLELLQTKQRLEKKLKQELHEGNLKVEMQNRGLIITLNDKILFDPGKKVIKLKATKALDKIAAIINKSCSQRLVNVEGHTDNQPIKHSRYRSNWELSTARATSVLHYLIEKGFPPQRLSAIGCGEYRPIVTNDTPEGRASNRRVEIVIASENLPFSNKSKQGEK